jgi:PAS domain S-box-containing protein
MSLIVIVDDRLINRSVFARLAAKVEADVDLRMFADPCEALAALERETPDLVVTDYRMPHWDGAEFVRRFRRLPGAADVPVIVVTIHEERQFRLRALEAGATDFLTAPVDHHEFVARARNLLRMYRTQTQLAHKARELAAVAARGRELEERQARALLELRARMAGVIERLPGMISATDRQGCVLFVNAQQAAFAGCEAADVADRPLDRLFGAARAADHAERDRGVAAGLVQAERFLERAVDALGRPRLLVTEKTPLRIGDGEVTGVFTCSIDVTDLDAAAFPTGFERKRPSHPRLSGGVDSLRRAAS